MSTYTLPETNDYILTFPSGFVQELMLYPNTAKWMAVTLLEDHGAILVLAADCKKGVK